MHSFCEIHRLKIYYHIYTLFVTITDLIQGVYTTSKLVGTSQFIEN